MGSPMNSDAFRLGTAEREHAVAALGVHFEAGRLTVELYDQRMARLMALETYGQVRELFADLPAPYPPFLTGNVVAPPSYPPIQFQPPFGFQPAVPFRMPPSDKFRTTAGLLQIFVPFGAGRFYTGHTGIAVGQLLIALFALMGTASGAFLVMPLFLAWSVIDGIVILSSGGTDRYGRALR